jgi:O-antigen/teichoic acid export membrane protein
MIVVARVMRAEEFGALGVIQGTLGVFQSIAVLGMGHAAMKFVAEHRVQDPDRAGRFVRLVNAVAAVSGAAMSVVAFMLAPWLANGLLDNPRIATDLRIGSALLFFGSLSGVQSSVLCGLEAFRAMARANLVVAATTSVCIVGGVVLAGFRGVVVGLVVASACSFLILRRAARAAMRTSAVPTRVELDARDARLVLQFGVPALLAGMIVAPVNWICSVLLVRQPQGYAAMGIYTAMNQWRLAALHVPTTLGQVLIPMFSERVGASDPVSLRSLLRTGMRATACVTLPIAVIVSIASPLVARLYGPDYAGAASVLAILMATALITSLASPVGSALVALGRMWEAFALNLGWGVLTVIVAVSAVSYGAMGLAVAQLAGYCAFAFACFLMARYLFRGVGVESAPGLQPAAMEGSKSAPTN